MSSARIALLAAAVAALIAGAVIAGVLIERGSGDAKDERPTTRTVSAAQVERNLEHEYRCELDAPRARATCRPRRKARFACEVALNQDLGSKDLGSSTVELEIDGASYEPVPGC